MRHHFFNLLACGLFALYVLTPAASAAPTRPCFEDLQTGIECGTVEAPLDHHGELSGTVRLQIFKLAASEGPRRGTMLFLAGGPGQSSSPILPLLPELFGGASRYDLLGIDQRGTGLSEVLRCERLEKLINGSIGPKYHRAVTACANDLGGASSTYNTQQAVEDIELVRSQLGIEQLTLFGVSYGTKLALAYAQKYPGRVAGMLLDSVLPVDKPDNFQLDTPVAIRRALRAICDASTECKRNIADPVMELTDIVASLQDEPLSGYAIAPDGSPQPRKMKATDLFETIGEADLNLFIYEQLFGAVHNARRGDPLPLLRLMAPSEDVNRFKRGALTPEEAFEFSPMLNIANVCEDALQPWPRGTAVADRGPFIEQAAAAIDAGALLPFDRETFIYESLSSYCLGWPDAPIAHDLVPGSLPNVPTLAINGDVDTRTPNEGAVAALASNPNAQLVTLPFTGHSAITTDLSNCALTLAKRFLITGTTRGKCSRMPEPIDVRPAPPLALSEVRAMSGRCSKGPSCTQARRLAGSVYLTMRDVVEQFAAGFEVRGGGLRGGTWEAVEGFEEPDGETSTIAFSDVEFVPGQAVSGMFDISRFPRVEGILRVNGDSRLRFRLAGTLDYQRGRDRLRLIGTGGGQRVVATTFSKQARPSELRKPRSWLRRPAMSWFVKRQSGWATGSQRQPPLLRKTPKTRAKR